MPRVARSCVLWLIVGTLLVTSGSLVMAAESSEAAAFFESKIRPVLMQHCYQCHSAKAGKSEGGLRLDSRRGIRAGGDRGPAIVPEDLKKSVLLTAISHTDPDLKMPPKKERLPESVINDFKRWINSGATDPREEDTANAATPPVTIEAGRKFWAFQKPTAHKAPKTVFESGERGGISPPVVSTVNREANATPLAKAASYSDWAKRELDHFILAKLNESGLSPSADAEPATLLRRLHLDLVGLPPSPEAITAFQKRIESDGIDSALAAEVDALLASPQFGERWGRHWLDVARFAESSGKEANISFPYAWRYRDYVIDAVNADLPFDRFLAEQIAGDLLPYDNDAERARLLIATGFLAIGPKNLDEMNPLQFVADVADEQLDTVTRAVMASSVACARCHDHKFDPFSMQDYYALSGVFASTKTYFGTAVSPSNRIGGDPLVLPLGADAPILHPSIGKQRVEQLKTQLASLKKEQQDRLAAAMKARRSGGDAEKEFSIRDALRIFWTTGGIEGQLEKVDESGQALPLAMGVMDRQRIINSPLLERGEINKPGRPVPRRFPQVIELADAPQVPARHSGRLEFARWLTHPDHPLTARVMTNRVWRHLFGAGLVRTMDNFGFSGERPSHPELLDTLAVRFMADGWSIKKLVREIVLSRTYRQSSAYREDAFRTDPENRLLWRASKRRLDAEAIRDAMLVVAGELDSARPVGSLVGTKIGDRPISLIGLDPNIPADLDGSKHRSVYLPVLRDRLPDVLDLFDFAEPSLVTGDRETTNVPVQALYLMNSSFVQSRATALANRVQREADGHEQRLRHAFVLCFSRAPDAEETKLAAAFFDQNQVNSDNDQQSQKLFASYCQALLATAEFRNLD